MSKQEVKQAIQSIWEKLGKYKYPVLILIVGVVLLAIPIKPAAKPQAPQTAETVVVSDSLTDTEAKLEKILSQIDGAGKVRVMLQYATGSKTIYQTDTSQEVSSNSEGKQSKATAQTVLASSGSAQDQPVAVQTIYPTYQGALIVSQGAGSAAVRLNLVNAVSSLTGLGADKITVIKMKNE